MLIRVFDWFCYADKKSILNASVIVLSSLFMLSVYLMLSVSREILVEKHRLELLSSEFSLRTGNQKRLASESEIQHLTEQYRVIRAQENGANYFAGSATNLIFFAIDLFEKGYEGSAVKITISPYKSILVVSG